MKRIFALYRDQHFAARAAKKLAGQDELAAQGVLQQHVSMLTSMSASGQLFMARYRTDSKSQRDKTDQLAYATICSTNPKVSGAEVSGTRLRNGALFTGPIASSLASAGARNLRDALVTIGIPDADLGLCCREISDGAILLSVDAPADMVDCQLLQQTLDQAGSHYTQQRNLPTN